jgi:hypothetical protein
MSGPGPAVDGSDNNRSIPMPELSLQARADHAYEPADGVSRIFLTVKVRADDEPVKGLATKDFAVWRGMQEWAIDVAVALSEEKMPGIYSLALKDKLGDGFKGQIAFVVRARSGTGRSQRKGWGLADLVKL